MFIPKRPPGSILAPLSSAPSALGFLAPLELDTNGDWYRRHKKFVALGMNVAQTNRYSLKDGTPTGR